MADLLRGCVDQVLQIAAYVVLGAGVLEGVALYGPALIRAAKKVEAGAGNFAGLNARIGLKTARVLKWVN